MATANRQTKPSKRGGVSEPARRQPAWTGARASPTFSPGNATMRLPNSAPMNPQPNSTNGSSRPNENLHDKVLQMLSGLTGTTITVSTRTAQRYEGVVASTSVNGNTPGLTLKDAKEVSVADAPTKDSLFIASTNIESWASGPAASKAADSFRTDADITGKPKAGRERELQAWQPSTDASSGSSGTLAGDDLTFGPGTTKMSWDQFAANESMFGVKTHFDEDAYTTKIDRSAPDFRERERKAQKLANEINGTVSSNPHIAEERNQIVVDDSGQNEEDKYGAVTRSVNAYVPPGARRTPFGGVSDPAPKSDIPQVAVNAPDGAPVLPEASTGKGSPATSKPPADPLPAFREFVSSEKQRLTQKRQAMAKNDMDKRMADLVKFSQSFKLNKPIPDDLVPILAKDEQKQKEIIEKTAKDASSTTARAIGAHSVLSSTPNNPLRSMAPPATAKLPPESQMRKFAPTIPKAPASKPKTEAKKGGVYIQPIPPFKGATKARSTATPNDGPPAIQNSVPARFDAPLSPNSALGRLNISAPMFRPGTRSNTPGVSSSSGFAADSPKSKTASDTVLVTPNPFFGLRQIKKNVAVNIKEEFSPFKNHKSVPKASEIASNWGYSGKRFASAFSMPVHNNMPHHSPMMQPPPPMQPPPNYDEDEAAQAATRGYVYAYPPYGYPGQPMMPGMPPPGFMPGYMQTMHFPPGMAPPNGQPMYAPNMTHMPPPGAYMAPPPSGYPPPNGAGPRPGMPAQSPSHGGHPYYHPSPQMQHAVPYMMMQPVPQSGYESMQQPPMGGHVG